MPAIEQNKIEWLEARINHLDNRVDTLFKVLRRSNPDGEVLAKLEMHKATLADLEEEIRQGSI